MRRLGPQPLTGAEKQRRHRDRVKARLAEGERLKRLFTDGDGAPTPGFAALYVSVLADLGASPEECDALRGTAEATEAASRAQFRAIVSAHAERDLAHWREGRRRTRSSLLARLDAMNKREENGRDDA